jgi:uncharacterized repeat protein (TIGR01451 family)
MATTASAAIGASTPRTCGPRGASHIIRGARVCVRTRTLANPKFKIRMRQKIAGSTNRYAAARLLAQLGQTVDYQITVRNTGNVPLTFGALVDENCDAGTIAGGPGEAEVLPHAFTIFTCTHVFTEADKALGVLVNAVTETGTPPEGGGSPVTLTSNAVVVQPRPPGVSQQFGCERAHLVFFDFPKREGNEASIKITVNEGNERPIRVYRSIFTFNGPGATDAVPLNIEVGVFFGGALVTGTVHYTDNGVERESHRRVFVSCAEGPRLGLSLEKLQKIAGGSEEFTTGIVVGRIGETVDYEIVATNTGNIPENIGFEDIGCDEGTIAGGPGATSLEVGESTTYTCDHVLTAGDALNGSYDNTAMAIVPGPVGKGAIFPRSNTVVAEVEPEGT